MLRDVAYLLPLLIVIASGLLVLVLDLFRKRGEASDGGRTFLGWLSVASFALAGGSVYWLWKVGDIQLTSPFLAGMVDINPFSLFFAAIIVLSALLTALVSIDHNTAEGTQRGEYYALVHFAAAGMITMAMAADIIVLIVGLELMSLSVYILVGLKRTSPLGAEGALKYYVTGAVSSALLLYGAAFLYGITGTTNLAAMGAHFQAYPPSSADLLPFVALLLLIAGFGFKIAAVPFHFWTPDAYEGAPTPISGFMAAGVKTASFAAFLRVLVLVFDADSFRALALPWQSAIVILSILTMFVGNLIALHQRNVKRMLAYSSIAHAGYLLIAFLPMEHFAIAGGGRFAVPSGAMFYYLLVYALANLGAFGALSLLGARGAEGADLDKLSGLARRRPLVAAGLTVCLLSLAGIPPMAGFFGKWFIFRDALKVADGAYLYLVLIAVLNSLISVYYYLRPSVHMYFHDVPENKAPLLRSTPTYVAIALAALALLHAGLLPGKYTRVARRAAAATVPAAARVVIHQTVVDAAVAEARRAAAPVPQAAVPTCPAATTAVVAARPGPR